jgi:hypothetical protein
MTGPIGALNASDESLAFGNGDAALAKATIAGDQASLLQR